MGATSRIEFNGDHLPAGATVGSCENRCLPGIDRELVVACQRPINCHTIGGPFKAEMLMCYLQLTQKRSNRNDAWVCPFFRRGVLVAALAAILKKDGKGDIRDGCGN